MGKRNFGNPPVQSTGTGSTAIAVNQSSGTVLAAITPLEDALYEVRWIPGGDTVATWKLQHTNSAGTVRDQTIVWTGTFASAQYVTTHKAETNDIFRAFLAAAVASSVTVKIQAEKLT